MDSEAEMNRPEDATRLEKWPEAPSIEFKDVSLRYRPTSPIILKGLTFSISPYEKVGIVGRTGSGKTSLTLALFRIVELYKGTILIDGVDTREVGLGKLRRSMTLIPQDPLLFTGSMRENIDPFELMTEQQVGSILQEVGLGRFDSQSRVEELGGNLSSGEKQLICIARALASRAGIVVMDEATSSIDPQTDSLIQSLVRSRFVHCTILTIAHRLHTVLNSDRILVMAEGQAKEFAPPQQLMEEKDSLFAGLMRELKT